MTELIQVLRWAENALVKVALLPECDTWMLCMTGSESDGKRMLPARCTRGCCFNRFVIFRFLLTLLLGL